MAQMKKPAPKKPVAPRTPSTGVKKPMPKPLTGPAAVRELQRQVSPAGVKKSEANAKKAIAKKYPELTKKSNAKKDFEKGYKSGKLTVNKGEVITPGSIVRGVAKVAAKVAGKQAVKLEAKTNARALKAANKPTNKTGTKTDRSDRRALQGNSNLIKNASPARPNRTRGGSLGAIKAYGGQGLATAKLTPKEAARQAEITKELNPVQRAAKNKALANSAKGKTQTPTAEAARRRNLNK